MDAVDAVSHSTVKVRSLKIKYMVVAFFFKDGYTGGCVLCNVYMFQYVQTTGGCVLGLHGQCIRGVVYYVMYTCSSVYGLQWVVY